MLRKVCIFSAFKMWFLISTLSQGIAPIVWYVSCELLVVLSVMLKNMMGAETFEIIIQITAVTLLSVVIIFFLMLKCTRLRALGSEIFYLFQNR